MRLRLKFNLSEQQIDVPMDGQVTVKQPAVLYTAQELSDSQKEQARANIGAGTSDFSGDYADLQNKPNIPAPYTLPEATSDTLGGVKADPAQEDDIQTVRIGADGKLYTRAGGGGADDSPMELVRTYEFHSEEDTNTFNVPVGSQYRDVLIMLDMQLSASSAGYLYFDDATVLNMTAGTYWSTNNVAALWIHNYGGILGATMTRYTYGNQVGTHYSINPNYSIFKTMPETVGFNARGSNVLVTGGTARVYAR